MLDTGFIRGVIPPLITPVDERENVDEPALRRVVERVIAGGVHGILALGSNGEFYGFDHSEQRRIVTAIIGQTSGRIPVYMGIGAITTKEAIRLAVMAEDVGASAITVLPPMFLGLNDRELYDHFKAIAEATSLPMLLYNNPERVGNRISPQLLEQLATVPNIVGIKDSSGDLSLMADYILRTKERVFKVFAGKDVLIAGALMYGAAGCVASTANVVPELVVDIYDKFMAGDWPAAVEAQYKLAPLRLAYSLGSFPAATKDVARLVGMEAGRSLRPVHNAADETLDEWKDLLRGAGIAVVE